VVTDNACPDANVKYITFAENVLVDVRGPETYIADINGDITPDGMTIQMGSLVQITASVSDTLVNMTAGAIQEVEFVLERVDDGGKVTLDIDYVAPYQILWDVRGEVRLGEYKLYAEATDAVGNVTPSLLAHPVDITIDPAGPPVARIVGYDIDPDNFPFDGQPEADYLAAMTRPNKDIDDKEVGEVRFEYQLVESGNFMSPTVKRMRIDDGDEGWIKIDVATTPTLLPAGDAHGMAIWGASWSIADQVNGLYKIRAVAYCTDGSYDEVGTPVFYAWIQDGDLIPADMEGLGEIGLWAPSAPAERPH
jgi:hypothetical protein